MPDSDETITEDTNPFAPSPDDDEEETDTPAEDTEEAPADAEEEGEDAPADDEGNDADPDEDARALAADASPSAEATDKPEGEEPAAAAGDATAEADETEFVYRLSNGEEVPFTVSEDGTTLAETALDNPSSPEAAALRAELGPDEYRALRSEYMDAKKQYATVADERDIRITQEAVPVLEAQHAAFLAYVDTNLIPAPVAEANPELSKTVKDTLANWMGSEIRRERDDMAAELIAKGVPADRATRRAAAAIAKVPDLTNMAMRLAIVNNLPEYTAMITGQAAAAKPAAEGSRITTAKNGTAPRPPVPPMGGNGAGAAPNATARVSNIRPTEEETAEAEALGIDPQKFAERRRGTGTRK